MRIRAWHLGAVVAGGIALLVASVLTLLAASVAGAATGPADAADQRNVEMRRKSVTSLDVSAARAARTGDGQRRMVQILTRQFKVQDNVVVGLRTQKMGYGEIAVAVALSQELVKTDKNLSQQAALDKVLARRTTGLNLGVQLGSVVDGVEKVETMARSDKPDRPDRVQRTVRPDKPEKPVR